MSSVRFIRVDGEAHFAVVPIALWNHFSALAEVIEAAEAAQTTVPTQAANAANATPLAVRDALRDGVHPLKAWRWHRNMTAAELAAAVTVNPSYVTLIETRKRRGSRTIMERLGKALDVPPSALREKRTDAANAEPPILDAFRKLTGQQADAGG